MKNTYFVEMTDTFGEDANYCWVNRFLVTASSQLGAIRKVTRETGYPARKYYDTGDMARYNVPGCAICYFVNESDGSELAEYSNVKKI